MKTFISFSGGVESTTMCILYGKGATAIWCDTGAEHDEMNERIDYCEERLKKIHNGDFELKRIRPKVMVKGDYVDNLLDAIIGWKYMPSVANRWCTGKFKIIPIDKFLSEQGDCELMIGFVEIGLINYPRFDAEKESIIEKGISLANLCREKAAQFSWLILTPEKTIWDTTREQ